MTVSFITIMFLRLTQIYNFVKSDINSRNMNEGEEVLKSGQVITVGCSKTTNIKTNCVEKKITSLVLQTSSLNTFPHTVEGVLIIENNKEIIIHEMQCSCKAGLSSTCKHVVAVLLFLERNDILSLEDLSCTDLRCVWSSRKNEVCEEFSPAPIITFCCVSRNKTDNTEKENIPDLFDRLSTLNSNSAISLHRKGRNTALRCSFNEIDEFSISKITSIINNSLNSDFINEISNFPPLILKQCCLSVLNNLSVSDPVKLCYETAKSRILWKKERELRVSGSRIYHLFTYAKNAKPDWEKKSKDYFWPKDVTNKFMKHGVVHEKFARKVYEQLTKCKVEQCGFVVNPKYSWLGYSPDGVVFGENGPELLLEIKCSYLGKTKTITECLDSCSFLDKDYTLKKKHPYYGQVQLGQLILNVQNCHLAIYSSFDKSMYIVSVPFDKNFSLEMLSSVRDTYMLKMIHYVCEERKKNNIDE